MHRWSLGVVLTLLVTVAPVSRAQGLSSVERKLAQAVEARLSDEMAALEKVVNIDSGTFNTEGVRALTERDPVMSGFGDANFVCCSLSVVDGLGVKGDGLHSPDESLDPSSILPATLRAAVAICRLLHSTN